MKSKSVAIVVMLMFALALGAGVVAGKLSSRLPAKEPTQAERGTLSDVLQLNPDQRARMQAIWEGVRETSRNCISDAEIVQRDHDTALMAMLTDEQKAKYQQLNQATFGKITVIDEKRKLAFTQAVERTDGILNDSQRRTYDQIIKNRLGELPDGGLEQH